MIKNQALEREFRYSLIEYSLYYIYSIHFNCFKECDIRNIFSIDVSKEFIDFQLSIYFLVNENILNFKRMSIIIQKDEFLIS